MPHALYIVFFFALGACVGSFLNVVVWRLPRDESLVTPPSHCPKCNTPLRWYDNIPVFGWITLGGKCRYCGQAISARYPIVEAIVGLLFVLYYLMFFIVQQGPCSPIERGEFTAPYVLTIQKDWPIYGLYVFAVSALLAASLIDAENFFIPQSIPALMAVIGVLFHALMQNPRLPGSIAVQSPAAAALALGGGIGLLISLAMKRLGWMPISFEHGWPLMEHEREEMKKEIEQKRREHERSGSTLEYEAPELPPVWSRKQINAEMRKEMAFLLPPMLLGMLAVGWVVLGTKSRVPPRFWAAVMEQDWLRGLLGAVLGGLVGGFVVWLTRILGSLAFGREAMGMGDVDLMFGVGTIVGAGAATVAFFVAPFFGLALAVYMFISGKRRELPYGPYLSLATAFVMLYYCPVANYLGPGLRAMMQMLSRWLGL
jgi:leader peptidase (prepilin peptidase)/N-methyltransferase